MTYAHTHLRVLTTLPRVYTHIRMHTHTSAYICACTHTYRHTHRYAYTHTYRHTHRHVGTGGEGGAVGGLLCIVTVMPQNKVSCHL